MMIHTFRYLSLLFLAGIVLLAGCKKDDPDEPEDSFDRGAMLANYADNVIIPRYTAFQQDMEALEISANAFATTPDVDRLVALRAEWESAYLSWQRCAMFEFGPAANVVLRSTCNTFPTDTSDIHNNITTGSWVLGSASNIDAIGLPALDYLLHGIGDTDAAIVAKYDSDPYADNRVEYLLALIDQMKTKIDQVANQWSSGYRGTFVSSSGTDIGSSLSLMVNDLNFDYELIKNAKIGIPLGVQTLGIARPEYTEAFYSGISKDLALESLRANRDVYRGMSESGNNGTGLDDYLIFLGAQHTNGTLHEAITNQFSASDQALSAVADPLSESIVNTPSVVENAHTKIQQHVVLYKTDMASALGVLITYADGDGD